MVVAFHHISIFLLEMKRNWNGIQSLSKSSKIIFLIIHRLLHNKVTTSCYNVGFFKSGLTRFLQSIRWAMVLASLMLQLSMEDCDHLLSARPSDCLPPHKHNFKKNRGTRILRLTYRECL